MSTGRPHRSILLYALGLAVLVAGGYLAFELGRYEAGYSMLDAERQSEAYRQEIRALEDTVDELNRQLAIVETSSEIDRETYNQVESNLDRLQARIQSLEEELAFYRGIVSPQDGVAGLRIQDLEVVAADSEQHYVLKLILVQAIVHSKRVTGMVQVKLLGSLDDAAAEFGLDELVADGSAAELAYGFLYFQSFEQELILPVGFEPDTVEVQIWPTEPRSESTTMSFQWSAVSG